MLPFQCREDQLKLMFDTVQECMDQFKNRIPSQPGTPTTFSTITTSPAEDQMTNLELGLSITIGIVGFFFVGLAVQFIKNQWDCQISCQFIPTINLPDNFLHRIESCMESCLSSTTDDGEEYSVVTPDTPTSGSSTPTPPPNYDNAVANVHPRVTATVSPRIIAPVAPPRNSILPRIAEIQTPIHEPMSPQFFTPAIDYDPDTSADSIHSMETPAPDVSATSTPVASISSTEFPPRSLDMIMPTPKPPSNVGPRSLPSQYRTPAYQSPSIADLTMDQSEASPTHMDLEDNYNETSLIEINTDENDTGTVRANNTPVDDESSSPSPIIERGTMADFTMNTNIQDTTFLGAPENETATTGSNNINVEDTIEDVTEEVNKINYEETIDDDQKTEDDEENEDGEKTEDGKKKEDGQKTEDDRDNNSGHESDNSPTNSEYEREIRRQRRLTRLAKNLKSQVNYENK